jgi:hypothetical protein
MYFSASILPPIAQAIVSNLSLSTSILVSLDDYFSWLIGSRIRLLTIVLPSAIYIIGFKYRKMSPSIVVWSAFYHVSKRTRQPS